LHEAKRAYDHVVNGPVSGLSALCGITSTNGVTFRRLATNEDVIKCDTVRVLIILEFIKNGRMWSYFCPPISDGSVKEVREAITDYIVTEKPVGTERAVDVALTALTRKYPCRQTAGAK
jgi:hypothetical protein